jgi:hypothetical protein
VTNFDPTQRRSTLSLGHDLGHALVREPGLLRDDAVADPVPGCLHDRAVATITGRLEHLDCVGEMAEHGPAIELADGGGGHV